MLVLAEALVQTHHRQLKHSREELCELFAEGEDAGLPASGSTQQRQLRLENMTLGFRGNKGSAAGPSVPASGRAAASSNLAWARSYVPGSEESGATLPADTA